MKKYSNVVILMSDEHNPFFSSVYGHPFAKTPNMERLAKVGTLFKNGYCPSPLCLPSRSAFVAGKRSHELQTYSNCNINLRRDFPSYGKVLDEQGVYTVYIGKTDVYADGEDLGFTEMILSDNRKLPGDANFARQPEVSIRPDGASRVNKFGIKEDAFKKDDQKIDAAIKWITEKAPTLDQPWVLTVNILNPHFPCYATKDLWDMYSGTNDLPRYGNDCESANHPYAKDLRRHFQTDYFMEEHARGIRRGYLADITYVDQQIGRLLEALEMAGLISNTNFIYTSDHGDMMGKFGMWWKCSLYEDSVRVPVIAAGPDYKTGLVIETPVDLLDVQASIFESVGAKRPTEWSGKPLQSIEKNDPERVVFAEYHGHGTRAGAYMVRKGDWKFIFYVEAPHQLFNLSVDPDELDNVYSKYPEKAVKMEQELRKICSPEEENEKAFMFQERQFMLVARDYPLRKTK